MFDSTKLWILSVLVITLIGECSGFEACVGYFYKTSLNYYYGRYYVVTDYYHRYYYSSGYYNHGPKYCDDKCCTNGNGYKYCCSVYGIVPSYKSSSKPFSTTGTVVGCTVGGTLFAVVVIFSALVFRCMWKDKKRIEPVSIVEAGSSKTEETIVSKGETRMIEDGSAIIPPSVTANPGLNYTVKQ